MKVDQKAFETEFSIAICHPTVKKSLETEFSFVICRPTCDKWQSKKLFLASFDPRSSIVKSVFDCRLSGVFFINFPKKKMTTPLVAKM